MEIIYLIPGHILSIIMGNEKIEDYLIILSTLFLFSSYKKAVRLIGKRRYSDVVRLCTSEIETEGSTHLVEALLLRATFYLLRGETDQAMVDFEKLLNMNDVDRRVSKLKAEFYFLSQVELPASSIQQYTILFLQPTRCQIGTACFQEHELWHLARGLSRLQARGFGILCPLL